MITEERLQKAITYLAETDLAAAQAKAYMTKLDKHEKMILSFSILDSKLSGQQAKEAEARTCKDYLQWVKDYSKSVEDYQALYNKRSTEATIIDLWRSLNKGRSTGNIV